jgi:hypothetical protein
MIRRIPNVVLMPVIFAELVALSAPALAAENAKMAIAPQFDDAGDFCEGLAVVKAGDKYGYIDKPGTYVVSPQFDNA